MFWLYAIDRILMFFIFILSQHPDFQHNQKSGVFLLQNCRNSVIYTKPNSKTMQQKCTNQLRAIPTGPKSESSRRPHGRASPKDLSHPSILFRDSAPLNLTPYEAKESCTLWPPCFRKMQDDFVNHPYGYVVDGQNFVFGQTWRKYRCVPGMYLFLVNKILAKSPRLCQNFDCHWSHCYNFGCQNEFSQNFGCQ